jgi:DNA-3-methyladenine glycosylase I
MPRCAWAECDPLYESYHDHEWGVPVRDERLMFEFLILEGFQAGLSWLTILKKRQSFRAAFDNFDVERVASYGERERQRLLADARIIRNRAKIAAASANARAVLQLQAAGSSLCDYFWSFVDGKPLVNHWRSLDEVPAVTPLAEKISKDLKQRGFKFVGPTIIYAHLQAAGLVNDHLVSCPQHKAVQRLTR